MKSVVFSFLVVTLFSTFAFAGCEDGLNMAEDAAMADLARSVAGAKKLCKASASEESTLPSGDEKYSVVISCKRPGSNIFIYSVVLHEVEDAFCVVKKVTRIAVNG